MENSASLALSYANTRVEERIASLTFMDNLYGSLQSICDQVYDLEEDSPSLCQERHQHLMKTLVNVMNRNHKFNSREQIVYQGDEFNLLMNIWISVIRALVVKRNSALESSKIRVVLNGLKSERLKEQMTGYFIGFLKAVKLSSIEQKMVKPKTLRALVKLQRRVKKRIMTKAHSFFEIQ